MKFVNKTIKLLCIVPILIGIFSLSNFAHSKPQCEIDKYFLLSYLVNSDKKCGDYFSGSDIVEVIRVLDTYWDWNTTYEGQVKLLSDNYKNILRKEYDVKRDSEYPIPKGEYELYLYGYHVMKIQSHSGGVLVITMEIEWFEEGYEGTTTYTFDMVKIDGIWVINWIEELTYTIN